MSSRTRVQGRLIRKYINWQDVFGVGHRRCPFPERHAEGDKHPSVFIYPNGAYCFGCGWHTSDILEACRIFLGWSIPKARRYLYGLLAQGRVQQTVQQSEAIKPVSPTLIRKWMNQRKPQDVQYLCDRYALSPIVLNRAFIGYEGNAFTIPHLGLDHQVWAVKFRRDDRKTQDGPKYWALEGRGFYYLYPAFALNWILNNRPSQVLLCEGEFDALSALSHNIPAISVPSGSSTKLKWWSGIWGRFADMGTTLYLAFDMDDAGQRARTAAFYYFERNFPNLLVVSLEWEGGKDVAEVLKARGRLW